MTLAQTTGSMPTAAETTAETETSTAAGIGPQGSNSPAATPHQTGARGTLLPHMETGQYAAAEMMIGLLWRPAMVTGTGPEAPTGLRMGTGSAPGTRTGGVMGTGGITGLIMMTAAGVMSGAAGLGTLPGVALALVTGRAGSTCFCLEYIYMPVGAVAAAWARVVMVVASCLLVPPKNLGPSQLCACSSTVTLSLACALLRRV